MGRKQLRTALWIALGLWLLPPTSPVRAVPQRPASPTWEELANHAAVAKLDRQLQLIAQGTAKLRELRDMVEAKLQEQKRDPELLRLCEEVENELRQFADQKQELEERRATLLSRVRQWPLPRQSIKDPVRDTRR
jgi:hypothetical protein